MKRLSNAEFPALMSKEEGGMGADARRPSTRQQRQGTPSSPCGKPLKCTAFLISPDRSSAGPPSP